MATGAAELLSMQTSRPRKENICEPQQEPGCCGSCYTKPKPSGGDVVWTSCHFIGHEL